MSNEVGPPSSRIGVRWQADGVKLGNERWRPWFLVANEESLIKVVRMLPPDEARKVLVWAQQLADLGGDRRVEWSDSWSDDDLREATLASLERFEQQEREGREAGES